VSRRFDVIVVGAGPAGTSAAFVLAAAGRRVALLERQRFPRYKTCGGGVVWRALAALPCRRPAEGDLPMLPVHRVAVHGAGARPIVVERAEPPVTMVMRADFDAYLADRAAEAGAQRSEGVAIREVRRDGPDLVCDAGREEYRAPAVIAADGAGSRLARLVPGAVGIRLGPALEMERLGASVEGAPVTRFDFGVVPGGYGWVFPKRDGLSAGVFSGRPSCPSLRSHYRDYIRRVGLLDGAEGRVSGHRIPVCPGRSAGSDGLLLAGDAAGLADPLTGEGISYAIRSGRLAAEAVLRAGGVAAKAARLYDGLLARHLLPEIRTARLLAGIVHAAPVLSYRYFRERPRFAEAVVDVFLGRRTYPDLLRRALSRPWKLLLR